MTRALLLLSLMATSTWAAEPLTADQLRPHLHTYCEGEQLASIPFLAAGVGTGTTSGFLFAQPAQLGRGVAWPLAIVGAAELIAGLVLLLRGPSHLARLDAELTADPEAFVKKERAHVKRIRDFNQPVLLIAEAVIAVAGGVMGGVGVGVHNDTVTGVGLGVALQGLAMFVLDWAVLDRARGFLVALEQADR